MFSSAVSVYVQEALTGETDSSPRVKGPSAHWSHTLLWTLQSPLGFRLCPENDWMSFDTAETGGGGGCVCNVHPTVTRG